MRNAYRHVARTLAAAVSIQAGEVARAAFGSLRRVDEQGDRPANYVDRRMGSALRFRLTLKHD